MSSRRRPGPRPNDDVLLGEVARTLGISHSTAWTRCLRGLIPAEFRGGRYIVKRRDLVRLAAAQPARGGRAATKLDPGH